MTEREFALEVVQRLRQAGFQALWAGGCVRDQLLGLEPQDYDVATDARPEEVQKIFRRTVAVGMSFGVVKVLGPKSGDRYLEVEVATFRADVSYSDGRHPDAVIFASAREDALRRDFTINGMFFDPVQGQVLDFVGGQEDLQARRLRAIGDPALRFAEDKLRLLRAVRFATRFNLSLDPATADAIEPMADQITVVSAERIADELRELLTLPQRARGVRLLSQVGLVPHLLPELTAMKGAAPEFPTPLGQDQWDHVVTVLDQLGPASSFPLALAAFLHEAGRAGEVSTRLKLSNQERERVEWLVDNHKYLRRPQQLKPSQLKTILSHPGIRELLALHRADALAAAQSIDHVHYCEKLLEKWTEADLNPTPLLTGNDLLAHGIEAGPVFKRLLDAVREAQLDETISTREQSLALVDRLMKEEGK